MASPERHRLTVEEQDRMIYMLGCNVDGCGHKFPQLAPGWALSALLHHAAAVHGSGIETLARH